ncbi:uncharacterized protein LOC114300710 [Camellia sinensis]|uniref:uncharacterized protein LOC114300710 n=1 Tax=Camellia sinensis TaxID=4442 RepID=UPI001035DCC9|nr:uncharacterized protein LOC114300710 [Camellia sinensis]
MSNFGFQNKWIRWTKECLQSSRVSILVNGSPNAEFSPEKGLRQGDPMSHFLFNIVAEGLNMLFQRAKALGLIKGAVMGHKETTVTHFHVYGVGVQEVVLADFVEKLNCQSKRLPFMYLGLPLGASPKRGSIWLPVINKFKSKLASWKRKLLSYGGRLTLIKSVLSSLPIYYLSLFKVLVGVAKQIDKIQARFLWGGSKVKKKLHMVKWEEVTMKKSLGGLVIKRLEDFNECLLAKWRWRYGTEDTTLWKDIVISMAAFMGDVGNGLRVSFWEDPWASDRFLKDEFSRIYDLSADKKVTIRQMLDKRSLAAGWSFNFWRCLRAWEDDEMERFKSYLSSLKPILSDRMDSLV